MFGLKTQPKAIAAKIAQYRFDVGSNGAPPPDNDRLRMADADVVRGQDTEGSGSGGVCSRRGDAELIHGKFALCPLDGEGTCGRKPPCNIHC